MNLTNTIAQLLLDLLAQDGQVEIQRNELAERLGCVPSQINYVISSRFTPEHGYLVESRRGGGGYIRITRAPFSRNDALMHLVNSLGGSVDEATSRAHIYNLTYQHLLDERTARLMLAAVSGACYHGLPPGERGTARAGVFKQMLLASLQQDAQGRKT